MNRHRARMVDGVDRAAFALMCAMTNWAQPNPTEQEQQNHWWGVEPRTARAIPQVGACRTGRPPLRMRA